MDSGPTMDSTVPDSAKPDTGGGKDSGSDTTTSDSPTSDSPTSDSPAPETGGPQEGGSMCTLFDASALDDASVAAGYLQVWKTYRCAGCHQNTPVDDAGNGIVLNGNPTGLGDSGKIFPPNLTNSMQGLGCWTDQEILTALLYGTDPEGGKLCPPMPVFSLDSGRAGTPMDAGTAQQIIDFLRSLPPSSQTVPETTCSSGPGDSGPDAPIDGGTDAPVDAPADAAADAPADAPDGGG
jgi:hypothetical protein